MTKKLPASFLFISLTCSLIPLSSTLALEPTSGTHPAYESTPETADSVTIGDFTTTPFNTAGYTNVGTDDTSYETTTATSTAASGYSLDNSLRFNDDDSAYLSRTPSSAGNRKTWTWSGWVKRGNLGINTEIFGSGVAANPNGQWFGFYFTSADKIQITGDFQSSDTISLTTNRVFRDPSAWIHLALVLDVENSTQTDRVRLYVNGERETDFGNNTYPSSTTEEHYINATEPHRIGVKHDVSSRYGDYYLSDIHFIDGQALDASYFGETDARGKWVPKDPGSLTYGTNGFHLDFADSGDLGKDANADTTTTSSTSGAWTGSTGSFTFSGDDISTSSGDKSIRTSSAISGDFDLEWDWPSGGNGYIGFFPAANVGSFNSSGTVESMSQMYDVAGSQEAVRYENSNQTTFSGGYLDGKTIKVSRRGSTITVYVNGTLEHTYSQTFSGDVHFLVEVGGAGSTDVDNLSWTTGTFGNDWTANNLTTTDQMTDTPTDNFATWNVFDIEIDIDRYTFSEGNLKVDEGSASAGRSTANITFTSGQWYAEATPVDGAVGAAASFGIAAPGYGNQTQVSKNVQYQYAGNITGQVSSSDPEAYAENDVIGVAADVTNNQIRFYKNGTEVTGSPFTFDFAANQSDWGSFTFAVGTEKNQNAWLLNAGQGGTSGLQWCSGAGGYFDTCPPAGFKALSTANLPDPAITSPSSYFDVVTYTGDGSGQSIDTLGFQPDLVWIKNRDQADEHKLIDSVRGVTKELSIDQVFETTDSNGLTAFLSNGFTLGTGANGYNDNGEDFVAWTWKKDPAAGFDIATYSGTGTAQQISHNLGVKPAMMIARNLDTSSNWIVYHQGMPLPYSDFVKLNLTDAKAGDGANWANAEPTSTYFWVGTSAETNGSGNNHIAYLWAEKEGYSKFGSYTGNGNVYGPFVYTGFKPRFILAKAANESLSWFIYDTERESYNPVDDGIYPNTNGAEGTNSGVTFDLLSNGFKVRTTSNNTSGQTYIYAAFAEEPFAPAVAGSDGYATQMFTFDLSSIGGTINKLSARLLAAATAAGGDGVDAKIWNANSTTWEALDSNTDGTMGTNQLAGDITTNVSNYIDGNTVRIKVASKNPSTSGTDAVLSTDWAYLRAWNEVDIGLRYYDGTGVINVGVEPSGTLTSALRIAKSSTNYGISLVDVDDPFASGIRVKTSNGIKALLKMN